MRLRFRRAICGIRRQRGSRTASARARALGTAPFQATSAVRLRGRVTLHGHRKSAALQTSAAIAGAGRKDCEIAGLGKLRTQLSLSKRPFAFEFFNGAVVDIDIHVIVSAGNCVKAGISICATAIQFTGELPDGVRLPCA